MSPVNPHKISEKQIQINGLNINYKTIGDGKTPIVLLHGWGMDSEKYVELMRWLHSPAGLWSPSASHRKNAERKRRTAPQLCGDYGANESANCRKNAERLHSSAETMEPITQFNIIIPDLPGFGKSDEPKEDWEVDDYVEFVDEFIEKINRKGGFELVGNILAKMPVGSIVPKGCGARVQVVEKTQNGSTALRRQWSQQHKNVKKVILIGHSFGGMIAIKYAVKYPEKIDKLILTGAAGIKHKLTVKQKAFSILGKMGKSIFSLPVIKNFKKPVYKIFSKIAQHRKKDYYSASSRMKEIMKNVLAEDITNCLDKIKTPTLLVWGREDMTTPLADGEIMNEKIPNSELKIIDNANHSLSCQKAEEFVEAVDRTLTNTDKKIKK